MPTLTTSASKGSDAGELMAPRHPKLGLSRRVVRGDWLLLSVPLAFFVVFTLIPVVAVVVLAAFNYPILGTPTFIGLKNLESLVHDALVGQSFWNTFVYVIIVAPVTTCLALFVCLLTEGLGHGKHFFRVIYFLPAVIPPTFNALIWKAAALSPFSLLNSIIGQFGMAPVDFLDATWGKISITVVMIWQGFGLTAIFYLAGLKSISPQVYEAARVDGASRWRIFSSIEWPLLRPTTFLVLVFSSISAFRAFDTVYVLTRGGPSNTSLSVFMYVYQEGWVNFKMGYAAAVAVVAVAAVIVVNLIQRVLLRDGETG